MSVHPTEPGSAGASDGAAGRDGDASSVVRAGPAHPSDADTRVSSRREPPERRGSTGRDGSPADWLTDSLPGYEIVRQLHRGGQGVVYQAVQKSTQRTVAVKVMREGPFATAADRARFEREVRLLGRLNHPNIVTVYDSGTVAGNHYFVMDYVDGVPLDAYFTRAAAPGGRGPLSVADRLRLLARVCDAVNAAHLRGIIHRDLKPSNILITESLAPTLGEGRTDSHGSLRRELRGPQPKILDFGLAKTADDASSGPVMTLTGQFVGSLPWSSPEQAEGIPSRIDLRTDVYSLGVIAYQALTGLFPYDVTGSMRDVLERITRLDPVPPSAALALRAAGGPRRRGWLRRRSDPDAIDDEVDTIVMRCLAKERGRRYQTAGEVARDIERYLAGEPIEAKRDSVVYFLRKQFRRYRAVVAVAAAFVLVISAGLVASLAFWRSAVRQRDVATQHATEAEQARAAESRQRAAAEASASEARYQADKAQAVGDFLSEIVGGVGPLRFGRDVSMIEVLESAARRVERGALDEKPVVKAAVANSIGAMFRDLGRYAEAEPLLREALSIRRGLERPEPRDVAESCTALALHLHRLDRDAEAEPLLREAVEILARVDGERSIGYAMALDNLADVYMGRGEFDAADAIYEKTLPIYRQWHGERNPLIAKVLNNRSVLRREQNDLPAAEQLLREALDMWRESLGSDNGLVAQAENNLGTLLVIQHRPDEAEPLLRAALQTRIRLLGDDHPDVAESLDVLGGVASARGQLDEAESLLRRALDIRRRHLGPHHSRVASSLANLGVLMEDRGDPAAAEACYRQALDIRRRILDPRDPSLASTLRAVASITLGRGAYAEAEPAFRELLELQRDVLPPEDPRLAYTLDFLGWCQVRLGRLAEAEATLREGLRLREPSQTPERWLRFSTMSLLGEALVGLGRYAEAEPLLLEGEAGLRDEPEASAKRRSMARERLAALYEAWGRSDEAARWRSATQPASVP